MLAKGLYQKNTPSTVRLESAILRTQIQAFTMQLDYLSSLVWDQNLKREGGPIHGATFSMRLVEVFYSRIVAKQIKLHFE